MSTAEKHSPIGILFTNLGTPDSNTVADIRTYLRDFLGDPRVIDTNRLVWLPILYGKVLSKRPAKALEAYNKIWTEEGSPLLVIAQRQAAALKKRLEAEYGGQVKLALGMRYTTPTIEDALQELLDAGCERIVLLPTYPQYSTTTTATTFDKLAELLGKMQNQPSLRYISRYFNEPGYIEALADSVRKHWAEHGRNDKLMMSFHGIPKRYADTGDPYREECETTAALLAEALELKDGEWLMTYQSRFGREEWLKPYTDKTLEQWGQDGVESVDVICPGFSVDCLETLEEIEMDNHDNFIAHGGKKLSYIPALNDNEKHIDLFMQLIEREVAGWI